MANVILISRQILKSNGHFLLHNHKVNFSFQQVNFCDLDFDYISKAVNFASPVPNQGKLFLVEFIEIIRERPDVDKL